MIVKLKQVSSYQKGIKPKILSDYKDGLLPYLNMQQLRGNEIAIEFASGLDGVRSTNGEYGILWDGANAGETFELKEGVISSTMAKFIPFGIHPLYLHYCVSSRNDELRKKYVGMGIPHVSAEILNNLEFDIPDIDSQVLISEKIKQSLDLADKGISLLTQKLHHLEEYKTALIHNAVTKGLDANGNEILNNPSWSFSKFKSVASYQKGTKPKSLQENKTEYNLPYLNMQQLRGNSAASEFAEPNDGIKVKDGDLIILWDGANAGELIKGKDGLLSSTMALIESNSLDLDFLYYSLRTSENELREKYVGMGIPHVSSEILNSLLINHPSSKEQQKVISNFVKSKENQISKSKEKINKKIALLLEYKKSLINEAVSGEVIN